MEPAIMRTLVALLFIPNRIGVLVLDLFAITTVLWLRWPDALFLD